MSDVLTDDFHLLQNWAFSVHVLIKPCSKLARNRDDGGGGVNSPMCVISPWGLRRALKP